MGASCLLLASAQGSRLKAQDSRLKAPGSRLKAEGSRLKAQGSRFKAAGSWLEAIIKQLCRFCIETLTDMRMCKDLGQATGVENQHDDTKH